MELKMMGLNQAELELLDHQAEADRDRDYVHRTTLIFDFDDARCDHRFESHLPVIARLCEQLAGTEAPLKLDLTTRSAPQRTMWAIVDDAGRGLIMHHDSQVQPKTRDHDEFVDLFWSSVGLPQSFAICNLFGRYLFDGSYDVNLTPMVDIQSNLSEEQHAAAVRDFEAAMLALGYPRMRPKPPRERRVKGNA